MSNNNKKVLIITYYWPPSAGVGVLRWLKFCKYLPEFGWEPIVYTPENPDFEQKDESLLKEIPKNVQVLKTPIWEPFFLFRSLFSKRSGAEIKQGVLIEQNKNSLTNKLILWIRANMMVPDPRIFWFSPSVKFLIKYLEKNPVDVIVSTGPPHSMHLIAMRLKKVFPKIKWLADFRDPWSNWDVNEALNPMPSVKKKHKKLEKQVLLSADMVSSVSPRLVKDFERLGERKVQLFYNGFDVADFNETSMLESGYFEISHFGIFGELRNPENLWIALEELCENADFSAKLKINLAGSVSNQIIQRLESSILKEKLVYKPYLKRDEVIKKYHESSVLLLLLNKTNNAPWIMPMKMYEYLQIGKAVLYLGPKESDAADVLREVGLGQVFSYEDKDGIKSYIKAIYEGKFSIDRTEIRSKTSKFDRKNVTGHLAKSLDELILHEQ